MRTYEAVEQQQVSGEQARSADSSSARGLTGGRVKMQLVAFGRHSSRYLRLMRLHRPIGIWLLMWPTLWALWFASEGRPSEVVFAVFVAGTIIVRSAGCIVNDLADRKIDAHVRRTADRPLATGDVSVGEAILLFVGLMLIAFGLVMMMNETTVLMAIAGALITIVYPFMKRLIAAPQLVLGLAFAWGVPMAFAAQVGEVERLGWLLYVTTLVWVLIYDTEYAMADRADDLKLGIQSTAILFGDMDRSIIAGLQLILLGGMILVGRGFEMGFWYYLGLTAASGFGLRQQYLIRDREPERCVQAFLNNAWLGAAVFAGIVLDYLFRLLPGAAAAIG
jgi:4-hydroxybenzoate polyprenyltransferase